MWVAVGAGAVVAGLSLRDTSVETSAHTPTCRTSHRAIWWAAVLTVRNFNAVPNDFNFVHTVSTLVKLSRPHELFRRNEPPKVNHTTFACHATQPNDNITTATTTE